jgi:hypothetical protein
MLLNNYERTYTWWRFQKHNKFDIYILLYLRNDNILPYILYVFLFFFWFNRLRIVNHNISNNILGNNRSY